MTETRYDILDSAIWAKIADSYKNLKEPGKVEEFDTLVRLLEFVSRNKAVINSGGTQE